MSSIKETSQPANEPVTLALAQTFLRLESRSDDDLIQNVIIPGARRQLETALGETLANRSFVQFEDSFPFYPFSMSPYAPLFGSTGFPFYFGFGPVANLPVPAVGGLQNQLVNPFEKRLLRSPVTRVRGISYVGNDRKSHGLLPGKDFAVDFASLPGRISPLPGQRWPVGIFAESTVAIYFDAGYLPRNSGNSDELVGARWSAVNKVAVNSYVFDSDGNVQLQTASNAITGVEEPTYAAIGASVSDGSASWTNLGPILGRWAANHAYTAPVVILDSKGNLQYLSVSSLTSGSAEPTWNATRGQVTTDNSVAAWTNIGADQSQGAGDPPNQITEYQVDNSIPPNLLMGLLHLITHWYQQRSLIVTVAGAGGAHLPLPFHLEEIIASERVLDFGRGK